MQIEIHHPHGKKIAELHPDNTLNEWLIIDAETGADLVGALCFDGFNGFILRQENITPDFFDLKTGIAGEILQKCSTYRIRLAIVGNFAGGPSKSLNDFVRESNRLGHINFVASREEALERLSK